MHCLLSKHKAHHLHATSLVPKEMAKLSGSSVAATASSSSFRSCKSKWYRPIANKTKADKRL